jgi:hypothetical protein
MGQNNDPTERGEPQGHQGGQPKLSPEERRRQSRYPSSSATNRDGAEWGGGHTRRTGNRDATKS